jgi:hypothetical protein
MKKVVLMVALIALTLVEIYLCTAFLPAKWQHAIGNTVARILPKQYDQLAITHPALDEEIDQFLRNNPGVRFGLYTLFASLLGGNTFLLVWVWSLVRRAPHARARPQT